LGGRGGIRNSCHLNEVKYPSIALLFPSVVLVNMAYSSQESISFREKASHFQGSASIKLKHLVFENDQVPGTRPLDRKNVARLIKIFELQECRRLEPNHYVPAVISEEILNTALQKAGISQANLLTKDEPPQLCLDNSIKLTCLHGKHRLAAADEFLLPGDKWWVVDLYKEGNYQ
jgi:hypothetical protein